MLLGQHQGGSHDNRLTAILPGAEGRNEGDGRLAAADIAGNQGIQGHLLVHAVVDGLHGLTLVHGQIEGKALDESVHDLPLKHWLGPDKRLILATLEQGLVEVVYLLEVHSAAGLFPGVLAGWLVHLLVGGDPLHQPHGLGHGVLLGPTCGCSHHRETGSDLLRQVLIGHAGDLGVAGMDVSQLILALADHDRLHHLRLTIVEADFTTEGP